MDLIIRKRILITILFFKNSFKLIDNTIRLMIPKGLLNHLIEKGFDIKDKFLYVKLNKMVNNIKQIEIKYINDFEYEFKIIYEIEDVEMKKDNAGLELLKKGATDPQVLLQNFIARKQALLADIANYQKEMASFAQVKEALKIVFDTLQKVSPEAYEQFKKEIVEKQHIKNLMR